MLGTVDCVKPETVLATEEAAARVLVPEGLQALPHGPAESAEELSSEGATAAPQSFVGRIGEVDDELELELDPNDIADLANEMAMLNEMSSEIADQTDVEETGQADQTDVEQTEELAVETDLEKAQELVDEVIAVISPGKRKPSDGDHLENSEPK